VVGAAAEANGVFLHRPQARQGLARAGDAGMGVGDLGGETRRVGRDARKMHQEVQGDPLGRQDGARRAFDADERVAGFYPIAVRDLRLEDDRAIDKPEGGARQFDAGDHTVLAAVERRPHRLFRSDGCVGRDVAGAAEILDQRRPHLVLDHQREQYGAKGLGHRILPLSWISRRCRSRCARHPSGS
jgi:hypothetical protein